MWISFDPKEYEDWVKSDDRYVRKTKVGQGWVSTIAIGVNYGTNDLEPNLFETITIDLPEFFYETYTTYVEAIKEHEALVKSLREKYEQK